MIPGPAQWVKGSCLATVVVWIQSLAWELPYAMCAAIKKKKKKKNVILKRRFLKVREDYQFEHLIPHSSKQMSNSFPVAGIGQR